MTIKQANYVIIRRNPHRPHATNILGKVLAVREGDGPMGCDFFEVRFEGHMDYEIRDLPFVAECLAEADQTVVTSLAEHHERLAIKLRAHLEHEV